MREGGENNMKLPYGASWPEESVHTSHFSERLTFEVSVNSSEVLSLIKQITDKSKELTTLTNRLVSAVQVKGNDQSR